jgi:hypothetical protein
MQRHVRSWITSRHGAYIVNVRLQPCQLIGCGPRSRPGGLAMFAAMRRARLNRLGSPLVRYSGGAATLLGRASLTVFGFAVRWSRDATSTQHGPSRQAAQPSWS